MRRAGRIAALYILGVVVLTMALRFGWNVRTTTLARLGVLGAICESIVELALLSGAIGIWSSLRRS